jgi:hypothetical protein
MAKEPEQEKRKALRVISEKHLSLVIDLANEKGVTEEEYKETIVTPYGFSLIYYR